MNLDRSIPVFVYPTELTFHIATQDTHKQLLTLYNPYDFAVKYQVFSNTSDKYSVIEPKGTIAPRAYIDLIIRHAAPFQSNCHSRDKFMITMQDSNTNQVLGKRYVAATLLPGEKDSTSLGEDSISSYTAIDSLSPREMVRTDTPDLPFKTYCIVLSAVFVAILFLPTKYEDFGESAIPSYLHVAVSVKILVAFVLGLITMSLLRPH